ncbi:MAG: hypothetical protein RBS78_09015, partial [Coriobacteriia bacterium]|nr:hypothetical protein [Coriobacteriia bacterium]
MLETGMVGERVVDALAAAGKVQPEQLASAEAAARRVERPVGAVLLERGAISADDVAHTLEETLGVPRVDLSSYAPDGAALAFVPAEVARARSVLPLFEIDSMLTVAIGKPTDVFELDALADELQMEVEAVLVDPAPLRSALEAHYGPASVGGTGSDGDSITGALGEIPESASDDGDDVFGEGFEGEPGGPGASDAPQRTLGVFGSCVGDIDLDVLAVAD